MGILKGTKLKEMESQWEKKWQGVVSVHSFIKRANFFTTRRLIGLQGTETTNKHFYTDFHMHYLKETPKIDALN